MEFYWHLHYSGHSSLINNVVGGNISHDMFKLLEVPGKLANPFKKISLDDVYSRMNRVYLFLTTIIFGKAPGDKDISV